MRQIVGAAQAAEDLNKYFPEVRWDRFVNEISDGIPDETTPIYTMYGWIDREDTYKDFVLVTFTWDGSFVYYTSSAKYSKIFDERINGTSENHTDCERVEDWFPEIKNVVRLKK